MKKTIFDTIVLYGAHHNKESLLELEDILSKLLNENIRFQYDSELNLFMLLLDMNGKIIQGSLKAKVSPR